MCPPTEPSEPVYRTYEGVEFEILPVSNFVSSPLVTTTSALIASLITPEDEDHGVRVEHAKRARSQVKQPFDVSVWIARLTDADIPVIRQLWADGNSADAIGARFDVSGPTINDVVAGRTWTRIKCADGSQHGTRKPRRKKG